MWSQPFYNQKPSGWKKPTLTEAAFRELLEQKIDSVNLDRVKDDVIRFIPNADRLKIWSAAYFHDLVEKMKIV
jgi:hypothetical protein